MKKAVVVGAGIAGIAAAIRLRKKGYEVDVFEANGYPGGKLHAFELSHYRFDAGPSLFTMPYLVTELFKLFGENPEEHFQYKRKDTVCNYFWEDGTRYTVPGDQDDFVESASENFGVPPGRINRYLQDSKKKYDLTAPIFLESSLHKTGTYLNARTLRALGSFPSLDIFRSLNRTNEKMLREPHLVQLFNRYATYNGSSPYETSGIMSMIPHLEMFFGTFIPKGGMHRITMSLVELAERHGVQFHYNEPAQQIELDERRATGVRTNYRRVEADLVVSNMDIYATYKHLLRDVPAPGQIMKQERSSSALIFYWGIGKQFPELDLHNIFFSSSYREEFDCLFNRKTLHPDPTVYVNITSKDVPEDAPEGCENWFVMVNAPYNDGQDWDKMIAETRKNILTKLNRNLGTDIESLIQVEEILDPIQIEQKTSTHRGSLYGTSSNSMMAAFFRHPNFSGKFRNLYFCGGSVHPGGGIPLCLNSAKIVDNLIS